VRADEHRVITKMKEDGFVFLFLYEEQKMFMEEESRKSDTFFGFNNESFPALLDSTPYPAPI